MGRALPYNAQSSSSRIVCRAPVSARSIDFFRGKKRLDDAVQPISVTRPSRARTSRIVFRVFLSEAACDVQWRDPLAGVLNAIASIKASYCDPWTTARIGRMRRITSINRFQLEVGFVGNKIASDEGCVDTVRPHQLIAFRHREFVERR